MSELHMDLRGGRWWWGLRQATQHIVITLLALGIAFLLPVVAQYILYQWWPLVASDAGLLLASEISLAASLVLLFNVWYAGSENRRSNGLTRRRERSLVKKLPAARDAFILTRTGYDTFADPKSLLYESLRSAYEIRVMLINPAAGKRVSALPLEITRQSRADEVDASIACLARLRALGKQVTLKFYEHEPFWKVAGLGDHLWVQYGHDGFEAASEPEYVFAHNPDNPRLGLFEPFYRYFLEQWNDARHPRYDFDTLELVYHDDGGREIRRARFAGGRTDTPALLHSPPAPSTIATGASHDRRELETSV